MTRFDQYGPLDTPAKPLGDRLFVGVNMRVEPHLLPAGYVSHAVNIRFRNGIPETRKGFIFPPWANNTTGGALPVFSIIRADDTVYVRTELPHGLSVGDVSRISGADQPEYNIAFMVSGVVDPNQFTFVIATTPATPATGSPFLMAYQTLPWGEVHGVGVFSDPFTHQEYLVIAANGGVYYTQPQNRPQPMILPPGVVLSGIGTVDFTQAFDVLLMHRGTTQPMLKLTRITNAWETVTQTVNGNGTHTIPNSTHSLFLQNRLFVPNDNDEIAVSDLNDYTRYVPILQEFKVNQGSADTLIALAKFNEVTIVAFKNHSIYALANVYGNLSALQQDEVTTEFGCLARRSIAKVGQDIWFLSELGVMSLSQTEENKIRGVVLPASDPIQPLIDRINWRYADGAVAELHDSRYYLAVPIDDAEVFGPELVPTNTYLLPGGALRIEGLQVGATYRYIPGNAVSLEHGAESYTHVTDFVASQNNVTALGYPTNTAPTTSLRRVWKCVNNFLLVYDLLNGAWSGYDIADGFSWQTQFRLTVGGKRRLMSVTHEGWLALMEDDYEDALANPYTDVIVTSSQAAGVPVSIQVNGGRIIPGAGIAFNITYLDVLAVDAWGVASSFESNIPAQNLFTDAEGKGGYYAGANPSWAPPLRPNAYAVQLSDGVRFHGTNAQPPFVSIINGSTWLAVSSFNTTQIVSVLATRGYASDVWSLSDYQWLNVDLQTWNPDTTVRLGSSGVNEGADVLENRTLDRTHYYEPSDAPAFDVTNVNDDFLTPYREDYSVVLGTQPGQASELHLHDGVPVDLQQEARVTESIALRGRSVIVQLTNEQGRMRLVSVALEIGEKQFSGGTQA